MVQGQAVHVKGRSRVHVDRLYPAPLHSSYGVLDEREANANKCRFDARDKSACSLRYGDLSLFEKAG